MHTIQEKKNDKNKKSGTYDIHRRIGHNTQQVRFFGHKLAKRNNTRSAQRQRALSDY